MDGWMDVWMDGMDGCMGRNIGGLLCGGGEEVVSHLLTGVCDSGIEVVSLSTTA